MENRIKKSVKREENKIAKSVNEQNSASDEISTDNKIAMSVRNSVGTISGTGSRFNSSSNTNPNIWDMIFDSKNLEKFQENLEDFLINLASVMGRFFNGAIIFFVIGYFCPDLREKLPYLYEFVDVILDIFNLLCKWLSNLLHFFF